MAENMAGIWPTIQNQQSATANFQKTALPMAGLACKNCNENIEDKIGDKMSAISKI